MRRSSSNRLAMALIALVVITAGIIVFNQQHSGDSLKIRRELRKF